MIEVPLVARSAKDRGGSRGGAELDPQPLFQTLSQRIDSRLGDLWELGSLLVQQRSTLGNEEAAQALVERKLKSIGFATSRVEPSSSECLHDPNAGYPPLPYEERTCVVGRLTGSGRGQSLHLSGHVDVVPIEALERWTHDPWAGDISQGRLWGRGAGDMKGGLAAYLIAADVVSQTVDLLGDVVFSAVIEEECTGNGMRSVTAAGIEADGTLIGEPTDLRLHHAGVGVIWARLTAEDEPGHAQYARETTSAIERIYPALQALRQLEKRLNQSAERSVFTSAHDRPYGLTVGEIQGGVWPSSSPAAATARIRLSFGPDLAPSRAQSLVRETVLAATPEVTVAFEGFRARAYTHSVTDPLGQLLARCHRQVHGSSPKTKVSTGTTDARYVEGPCLCYGPTAGNVHGVDEWVDLDSLRHTALCVALFMVEWCGYE